LSQPEPARASQGLLTQPNNSTVLRACDELGDCLSRAEIYCLSCSWTASETANSCDSFTDMVSVTAGFEKLWAWNCQIRKNLDRHLLDPPASVRHGTMVGWAFWLGNKIEWSNVLWLQVMALCKLKVWVTLGLTADGGH